MKTNAKWKVVLGTSLLVLTSQAALAGGGSEGGSNVGNGGDGIVCKIPGGKKTVELLDYYEARTQLKDPKTGQAIRMDFGAPGLSVDEIVELLISRVAEVSPERAERYRAQARTFMGETQFLPNADLTDIPDSLHAAVPSNCEIKQLVNQRKKPFAMQARYNVDKTLWDLMASNASKAGTILHEVIYREAIEAGQTNSVPTRLLQCAHRGQYPVAHGPGAVSALCQSARPQDVRADVGWAVQRRISRSPIPSRRQPGAGRADGSAKVRRDGQS